MDDPGQGHTYRVVLGRDDTRSMSGIQFDETSADAAMRIAQKVCRDRPVEIFEDDRLLCRLSRSSSGFWIVS